MTYATKNIQATPKAIAANWKTRKVASMTCLDTSRSSKEHKRGVGEIS